MRMSYTDNEAVPLYSGGWVEACAVFETVQVRMSRVHVMKGTLVSEGRMRQVRAIVCVQDWQEGAECNGIFCHC